MSHETPPISKSVATGLLVVPIHRLAPEVQRYFNACLMPAHVKVAVHSVTLLTDDNGGESLAIEISKEHK